MTNYTQTTFFTPKDSLPITDPNKTIFGAAYDVEFANIAAAIATKLDSTFTTPSLVNLNVTGTGIPVNGIYLPAGNTLGFAANSTQVATVTTSGWLFGSPTGGSQGAGTINAAGLFVNGVAVLTTTSGSTFASVTVNGSAAPANGIYLPAVNTFGIAANTTQIATFATGGSVYGTATGGAQGAGTINAQGIFVNGVAVGTSTIAGSGTATLSAASIAIGQTYIVWRSANAAAITSNTTLASDAVLQITSIPAGTYTVQFFAFWVIGASGVGAKCALVNTAGSAVNSYIGTMADGANMNSVSTTGNAFISNAASSPVLSLSGSNSGINESATANGVIVVSSAATIAFQQAQATSSASGVTLQAGSWVAITRIK
jgi:hypothetical protein